MVSDDMRELGIDLQLEEIRRFSKQKFKEMIRAKVQRKAFEYLTTLKSTHSKARNIKHEKLQLQTYLQSGTNNLSINEKQFIFAARTRMLDLRGNFKTGKVERKCQKCKQKCEIEKETQQHILDCPALRDSSLVVGRPNYQDLFGAEPSIIRNILKLKPA